MTTKNQSELSQIHRYTFECMQENRELRAHFDDSKDIAIHLDREHGIMSHVANGAPWNKVCFREMRKVWEQVHAVARAQIFSIQEATF